MPVNWKAPDAFERLLAAMVAAQDMKLDYRKIATYYGNNATYDSIEGRFRIIKREAAVLKAEIESGARPEAPTRNGQSASSSFSTAGTTPTKTKNRMPLTTPKTTPKKPRSTTTTVTGSSAGGTPKSAPTANASTAAAAGGRVERTIGGRVAKNAGGGTPSKDRAGRRIKAEIEIDADTDLDADADADTDVEAEMVGGGSGGGSGGAGGEVFPTGMTGFYSMPSASNGGVFNGVSPTAAWDGPGPMMMGNRDDEVAQMQMQMQMQMGRGGMVDPFDSLDVGV